jgi:hypothetical protein
MNNNFIVANRSTAESADTVLAQPEPRLTFEKGRTDHALNPLLVITPTRLICLCKIGGRDAP